MKKLLTILLVSLFMVVSAQAQVQLPPPEPGDLDTFECRQVQLEAQDAVLAGMPYDNHGGMVSTAAKVVSGYAFRLVDGISCECASCIVHQFAHGTPIEEQEPCGPDGEIEDLVGPDQGSCDGPPIGTIAVIDLGADGLLLQVEVTNGPPNTTLAVHWVCTEVPGGCHPDACGFVGPVNMTTDSNGKGSLSLPLTGNPFPGKYVHFDLNDLSSGYWYTSTAHQTIFPVVVSSSINSGISTSSAVSLPSKIGDPSGTSGSCGGN